MSKKGRHTTLDKQLKRNVLWIEKIASVSKVVLGFSECCRHKYPPGHIKFKLNVTGGIKVNGYSGKGVTDIFIKINPITDREQIKNIIATKFTTE